MSRLRVSSLVLLSLVLCVALTGCFEPKPLPQPTRVNAPEGGVLAMFKVEGETFIVHVTDEKVIKALFDLKEGRGRATVPNGKVVRGRQYDRWSWHLEELELIRVAEEVCDGKPSMVEEDLGNWVDTVGRFCPRSAELVRLEDYR